jgi:hypothetical protein
MLIFFWRTGLHNLIMLPCKLSVMLFSEAYSCFFCPEAEVGTSFEWILGATGLVIDELTLAKMGVFPLCIMVITWPSSLRHFLGWFVWCQFQANDQLSSRLFYIWIKGWGIIGIMFMWSTYQCPWEITQFFVDFWVCEYGETRGCRILSRMRYDLPKYPVKCCWFHLQLQVNDTRIRDHYNWVGCRV